MVTHIHIPNRLRPFFLGPPTNPPCPNPPNCPATPHEEAIAIMRAMSAWSQMTRQILKTRFCAHIAGA
ncbi:hypothetical protein E2P81_ATG07275 [Venturia nashicola]|uniref:Uncharacterized protein n=1 Tax=Venturia nashicola TaxID=86259 RepID=A0A4Z1P6I1_9PEZI|nr:hypothetical protein E6O75_ATG07435 [Venturia nashicola]TLD31785.1 hypothetical protein E2P81_ATG07275 [Venturia nashicola]